MPHLPFNSDELWEFNFKTRRLKFLLTRDEAGILPSAFDHWATSWVSAWRISSKAECESKTIVIVLQKIVVCLYNLIPTKSQTLQQTKKIKKCTCSAHDGLKNIYSYWREWWQHLSMVHSLWFWIRERKSFSERLLEQGVVAKVPDIWRKDSKIKYRFTVQFSSRIQQRTSRNQYVYLYLLNLVGNCLCEDQASTVVYSSYCLQTVEETA